MGRRSKAAQLENANQEGDLRVKILQKKSVLKPCVSSNPQNDVVVEKKFRRRRNKKKKTSAAEGVKGDEKGQTDKAVEVSGGAVEKNDVDGGSGGERVRTDEVVEISKETNQDGDLRVKILQKNSVLKPCVSSNPESDAVVEKKVGRRRPKKKKTTTANGNQDDSVEGAKGDEKGQTDKAVEVSVGAGVTNVVDGGSGGEKVLTDEVVEISKETVETNPEKTPDNSVLRKLLRGPRYFDPPENSWGACYNCGEEGHSTVNCTSARRKKPCFVCGGFEHNAKQCSKGRDCFICKQQGHRAKDCPEKNSSKICLKCGDDGHDMFSCRNEYCPDDLKAIQCYVCRRVGHLCCVDYGSPKKIQVSCYRCGGSGHTGLACTRSQHSYGETNGTGTPSSCYKCGVGGHFARECTNSAKGGDPNDSCYKCGEEGHFARECTNSKKANHFERPSFDLDPYANSSCYKCGEGGHFARECTSSSKRIDHYEGPSFDLDQYTDGSCYKCGGEGHFARQCTSSDKAGKRNREHSTPKQSSSKRFREHIEVRSAPHNLGKAHAYKSHRENFSSPVITKHRGGWTTEDPVPEYYDSVPRGNNNWRSPATPRDQIFNKSSTIGNYYVLGHGSHSPRNPHEVNFRYSASRDSHPSRNLPREVSFRNAASYGMASYYEQRYHQPSRFGSSSSHGGPRRDYDRW